MRFPRFIWFSLIVAIVTLLVVVTPLIGSARSLPRSHPMIASSPTPTPAPTPAPDLLDAGRRFYAEGQLTEALQTWQRAAQTYEQAGDRPHHALALSYLCWVYQDFGDWQAAQRAIAQSLEILNRHAAHPRLLAQVLNTQGSLQFAMGQPEPAIETWKQAARQYQTAGDSAGEMGARINQIQALQSLGLYRRAHLSLLDLQTQMNAQPDSALKVTALRSLGSLQQAVGNLAESKQVLEQSLAIARRIQVPQETSATLLSLGNTLRALRHPEAVSMYQQAAAIAPTAILRVEAHLNQLGWQVDQASTADTSALQAEIQRELASIPPSRRSVYAQVNFAKSLMKQTGAHQPTHGAIAPILSRAIQQAQTLQDTRAHSYAIGQLGALYEQTRQWSEAEQLTQQALMLAQAANADDSLYRWYWQLGRIQRRQGADSDHRTSAITAYTKAVRSLERLRGDLLSINQELQYSFRDSVEPVYRELVALLLDPPNPSQDALKQARQVIEGLQLSELENFFRSACLDMTRSPVDTIDQTAAVIYPIVLDDRLSVILSLPNQPLRHYTTPVSAQTVNQTVEAFLQSLNPAYSDRDRLRYAQQIYQWLVAPGRSAIVQAGMQTLVFVPDGSLRSIPLSALHDGRQYLIEPFNIALTPGLELLGPKPLRSGQFTALLGGVTEARQGFSSLPGVATELQQIATKIPAQLAINEDFTALKLQKYLQNSTFPVIHLATHGQFSSKFDDTFILAWDRRINPSELNGLLRDRTQDDRHPIELLVFSACQTAAGDQRATLGLAGLAVRSGARSTLATLWAVQDASTAEFMTEFYRQLTQSGQGRAKALRQAQLAMLAKPEYQHPFYWSAFVLIGNWL